MHTARSAASAPAEVARSIAGRPPAALVSGWRSGSVDAAWLDSKDFILARVWRGAATPHGNRAGRNAMGVPGSTPNAAAAAPRWEAAAAITGRASLAAGREDEPQVSGRAAARDLVRELCGVAVRHDAGLRCAARERGRPRRLVDPRAARAGAAVERVPELRAV